MNATEPRRRLRWAPRSVRTRAALAVAAVAAAVLAGTGWWVHGDVHRQNARIAEEQARKNLFALTAQVTAGSVPDKRNAVPFEVVATGRRTPVAVGGGMEDFGPGAEHVLPTPPALTTAPDPPYTDDGYGYSTRPLPLPERPGYDANHRYHLAGRTFPVLYVDIWAAQLSGDEVEALGVDPDATLRVYVVSTPETAERITEATDRRLLRTGIVGLVLIAGAAYLTVRLALRPVEAIRVLTASVNPNDPRQRVTVPAAGHEITALATTLNSTLERLDTAAAEQRRFVADAAHELRSPLTTLLASLEVALAYPERTDWPASVTTAARQTRRLQALAEDLLLLARLDTRTPVADPGTVDLAGLASRLVEQYPLDDRPLALSRDGVAPAYVHGDPGEYERLLRNLVDNAVRHAAHRVQLTVRNEDGQVVVTVHDDGPGVPAVDAERVFERFVRLDDARSRDRGGAGLGLAIARDLAHRHRGTLTLTPRTLGACFELRLPEAPAPADAPVPADA
ncbi:HAMP domain-containing sensor histidine kinase [Streptomyces sp. Z26]|uniref:sensor histidine kinase n=1 Tax=Streptomyces sp. Z26 TaxID=2500177 RepID=UPI000EF16AEB|nr:HAMP domain-containing sensor histidine kinase [Streptomyces sp. Z26]RLL67220.1 sensor histidine kinase [Streptomyces sp. Z26]